jgi:hypothetical protein
MVDNSSNNHFVPKEEKINGKTCPGFGEAHNYRRIWTSYWSANPSLITRYMYTNIGNVYYTAYMYDEN